MLTPLILRSEPHRTSRKCNFAPAFSLIELLVVITIIAVLLAASIQIFSNPSHRARQASRDIIQAHLQQARAHAIASGKPTAIAIPMLTSGGEIGARAMSLIEVEKTGATYTPALDDDGEEKLLQRWEILPGDFHFIPASMTTSASPTIVDSADTLESNHRGNSTTCHIIVFASNGQIVLPTTAVNIAIAKATSRGGSLVVTERTGGAPVYEFLQVNRLTGRARSIQP